MGKLKKRKLFFFLAYFSVVFLWTNRVYSDDSSIQMIQGSEQTTESQSMDSGFEEGKISSETMSTEWNSSVNEPIESFIDNAVEETLSTVEIVEQADSVSQSSESVDEQTEETEPSSESQEGKELKILRGVTAVSNVDDLKKAVQDKNVTTILLTQDINLGMQSLPVNHSVIIDGTENHYTLTYGGGTLSTTGIYYDADNVTIHYKNINFGYQSALGQGSTTNANNYFGIAPPGGISRSKRTLIVENVGYYSDYGAQPFHMRQADAQIIFRGQNEFLLKGGFYSQEFAEASNFTFEKNSRTRVVDENTLELGFIWSATSPLNFRVEENAVVDIRTSHHFLYTDPDNPRINLADSSTLTIYQSDTPSISSTTKIVYQEHKSMDITLGQASNFSIRSQMTTQFKNLSLDLAADASADFSVGKGPVLKYNTAATFNLDNAERLSFNSENAKGSKTGPIGSETTAIHFLANQRGYSAFVNHSPDNLLAQWDTSSWSGTSGGFSRSGTNFSSEEKSALNSSIHLLITKNAPTLLSWDNVKIEPVKPIVEVTEKEIEAGFSDTFYWIDQTKDEQLRFELWSETEPIAKIGEGLTTDAVNFTKVDYTIDEKQIPVGPSTFWIKVFKQGKDSQFHFQDELPLEMNVIPGELSLLTVPDSLKWTGRFISESKGILQRDVENAMSFEVKETRRGARNWQLTANVTGSTDYSLVWQEALTGPSDLDGRVVWTNLDQEASDFVYKKSWSEDAGVLLKSDDYLPIGEHSGELLVVWNLGDVATNIE